MLTKESWEVQVESDMNGKYKQFIKKFLDYFNKAFPPKLTRKRESKDKFWISKGIIVSCQKMTFLNNLKQRIALSKKSLSYINGYHRIYKCVISEGKIQ
jgi:hypothetical protein